VSLCHGSAAAGGLDLRPDTAYDALVGRRASNPSARAAGRLRVVPGESTRSFLSDKVLGTLLVGEGARMPLDRPGLPIAERRLLVSWIDGGAPPTGEVAGAPHLPPVTYEPAPPLPVPDPSVGYQMVLEGPVLQPGEEQEGCLWIPAPNAEDVFTSGFEVSLNPGTHHFAIWRHGGGPPPRLGVWTKDDIACLSGARFGASVGGTGEAPYARAENPPGLAGRLPGGGYYGLNAHYYNEFDVPIRVKVWTNFYRYQGTPEHLAKAITSLDTTFGIMVPPFTQQIRRGRWVNDTGTGLHLTWVGGHMHKRGVRFSAWHSDGTKIFDDFDWAHPRGKAWWPARLLQPGDFVDYECLHDNGVTRPVRLDRDGNPTTIRFGISAEDEMCILNVGYYDD
jgi:hypothetical protein